MKNKPRNIKKNLPLISYHLSVDKGFTLIELMVVIGILAILLSIVLVAINPARQFAQANNTKRRSDVVAMLNGIHEYAADNKGVLPPGLPGPGLTTNIASTGTGNVFCAAIVPIYLAELPRDPLPGSSFVDCNSYNTNYTVYVSTASAGNTPRITIIAPNAELSAGISATR